MDDIIYMENKGVNNLGWKIKKSRYFAISLRSCSTWVEAAYKGG